MQSLHRVRDLIRSAKRSESDSKIDNVGINTSGKDRVSTGLALWLSFDIVADFEVKIASSVHVPDLITSVVKAEGSGWEVRHNIIVVGHSLVAV